MTLCAATLADRQFRHCDKNLDGKELLSLIQKNSRWPHRELLKAPEVRLSGRNRVLELCLHSPNINLVFELTGERDHGTVDFGLQKLLDHRHQVHLPPPTLSLTHTHTHNHSYAPFSIICSLASRPAGLRNPLTKLFSQNLLIPKECYKAAAGLGVSLKEGSFPRTRFRHKHKTAVDAIVSMYKLHTVYISLCAVGSGKPLGKL